MADFAALVKDKRRVFGMTQRDFASLLGLNANGERTIRGWENGEHEPSPSRRKSVEALSLEIPFRGNLPQDALRSIDLFAGIGGMRLGFQRHSVRCVFTSEWDKFAQKTYAANFGALPKGDITQIPAREIPDHDVLLAGFPCQAFSQAGLKKGFSDTRGTLFFDIQRILAAKSPRMFLLENVKQLRGHDKGQTLRTIMDVLTGRNESQLNGLELSEESREALQTRLNYAVGYKVIRSCDFGIPQNRERIYIVGFDRNYYGDVDFDQVFSWPLPYAVETRVGSILEESSLLPDKYTISQRLYDGHVRRKQGHKEKGNGFGFSVFSADSPYTNTISARYYKDGSEILIDQSHLGKRPRKLTPRECARLQGYPKEFIVDAVSDGQIYKQFGNSVSVPVVTEVAREMIYTDTQLDRK
jgi:DNA (cytosine-5)-methyltransferase 1